MRSMKGSFQIKRVAKTTQQAAAHRLVIGVRALLLSLGSPNQLQPELNLPSRR
jgi:hypothetical protein